jgi:DeoR/GlpR family transcriptional regulator of sugar metabolism
MADDYQFIEERQNHIIELLQEYGRITVKELCQLFNVSNVTIRSDLNDLEKQDLLVRTHGGAMSTEKSSPEIPFNLRMKKHSEEKERMAKAAADLIVDGEAIFFDGGTTVSVIRFFLQDKKDVTIITPSIEIASYLAHHSSVNIFVMGGFLKRESFSTLGASSANVIGDWNISKAFFGAYGFTENHGLTDIHTGFIEQKRFIAEHAHVNIGMIDSSKWGKVSLDTFLSADKIDTIISDKNASPEMKEIMDKKGIQAILV